MKLKLFCLTAVLPLMFHTQTASYDSLSVNTLIRDTITEKVSSSIDEVVISGTMKAVKRLESPIPVEVYSPAFFRKNPTPNIFDALQNVNGVRPQLNCNICSTGDIHINGLEGPYTMVLIDGMPMVSSLGTVYGLTGIPNSLVERIEIVKGPASSLYGSEAVGGIINIITKKAGNAPAFSADVMSTTWAENNIDLGFQIKARPGTTLLTGINYYSYKEVSDMNSDRFTDVPLQKRISVFQKWNFRCPENKLFSMAARYMYEDRWGGDVRWNRSYRGGNEIYGESIYTQRAELFGAYQLPVRESMNLAFSFVHHDQDSRYGTLSYIANQKVAFGQLAWDRRLGKHDLLAGAAVRYTYYDDNTPATVNHSNNNQPDKVLLPGIFVQDEIKLNDKHSVLGGLRFDYNQSHGSIFTPRFAYKWAPNDENILRFNAGTGFRVVNLFTEDHAALTGSRDILILNGLKPEKSYNANLNFTKKFYSESGTFLGLEATAFYTYFTNRIVPDYETDVNKIIYDNLEGHAVSRGLSINTDLNHHSGVKFILGATLMENTLSEFGMRSHQLLTENFTGTWAISYKIRRARLTLDYTGNVYSPMRLPLLGDLDPRKPTSPWWSIQNIQLSYDGLKNWEIYGGVKNLLNWTPNRGNPFLIARNHDPFDQNVVFDPLGQAVATPENPYALTFDPTYVYAPNQGIRGFLGVRFKLD
ncbi:TonB-dependent receptor plug domain-containing protein [Chryseobacterium sp.]|uniref:TonB-dependent receptor plug domain-containing protein n=1 Tax=Chryseobacterium sp. TaxID=1871047 RepID=UPI0012A9B382|nr:TonB-dependent receptor [Chryseobacterium sp.]QFG53381.1 TonB-dependent receptor plug domain-containing protein [Chryseobacterium sp.]